MINWRCFNALRKYYAILCVLSVFLILKVIILFRGHVVFWDEAVYLAMGKYIYSLGSIGLWESIRPIGFPLILGLFWKLRLPYIFSSELLIIISSTATLFFIYLIGGKMYNEKVGILASLLTISTSIYFAFSSFIMTEIISTLFVVIAFYFFIDRKYFISGIFSSLAVYFRFPHLIFFICGITFLFMYIIKNKNLKRIKHLVVYIVGFILTLIPYLLFNYAVYQDIPGVFKRIIYPWITAFPHQFNPAEAVTGIFKNVFYYIIEMIHGNFLLLFFIVGIAILIQKKGYKEDKIQFLILSLCTYLIYFTIISNKQPRFLITFLPFVTLIASYSIYNILEKVSYPKKWVCIIFLLMFILGFITTSYIIDIQRSSKESESIGEYTHFLASSSNKEIYTSDPVPAAYVDKKFIPYYFSVDFAYDYIFTNKINRSLVIFTKESFYCDKKDDGCISKLKDIEKYLVNNHHKLFDRDYGHKQVMIFSLD